MIGLIKNEWIKVIVNRKLYGITAVIFGIHMLPTIMTLFLNMKTLNGQVYPLTMFGVITSFAVPLFLIVLVAETVTEEHLSGNLAVTLLQPVTRIEVISAKVLFVIMVTLVLQIISLGLGYIIGTVIFGWDGGFMLRGSAYTMSQGIWITSAAYISASLPLLAFSMFVMFMAVIIQGSAAVVGVSAGFFILSNILNLLEDALRPYLITSYFNTVPTILSYMVNPGVVTFPLVFLGGISLVFYLLVTIIMCRKDMVY